MVAPVIAAAGIGAASNLIGGLLGKSSAKKQNQAAAALSREQMAFQERMSSTAHQREVTDLRAAGLNPILSAGGKGASSPGGAMPNVVSEGAPLAQGIQAAGSTALQYIQIQKDLELAKSQIALQAAQASERDTAATKNIAEAGRAGASTDLTAEQTLTQKELTQMRALEKRLLQGDVNALNELGDLVGKQGATAGVSMLQTILNSIMRSMFRGK